MKDNLEKNIKQSLENHEMPYNASAWTAMQARLDVVKPASPPASNLKWYISAASVVVVGIVAYVAFNYSSNKPSTKTPQQAKNTTLIDSKENSTTSEQTIKNNATNSTTSPNNDVESVENSNALIERYEKQLESVKNNREFDALTKDISIGLPAEINARCSQYEYYRNQLLTFPELTI